MTRNTRLLAAGLVLALAGPLAAQTPPNSPSPSPSQTPAPPPGSPTAPKPTEPANPVKPATFQLYGSLENIDLAGGVPAVRVITNQKGWEAQARLWGINNPAKIDFTREFLVVATAPGSDMVIETVLDNEGDLRVNPRDNGARRAGFRYGIKSVNRAGVKTVNGRPLPVE